MDDVYSLFERGGPTMYAIATVAILSFTIFIERLVAIRGLVPDVHALSRRVRDAAAKGDLPTVLANCAEMRHHLAPILGRGIELAMRGEPHDEILAVMAREARRLSLRMRRGLGLLASFGTMAPFLGLLGTVLGIMRALHRMGEEGSGGFDVVSRGVAEALITTATGIVVAVVIVILHQVLGAWLGRAVLEVQLLVEEVADHLSRVPSGTARQHPAVAGADSVPEAGNAHP